MIGKDELSVEEEIERDFVCPACQNKRLRWRTFKFGEKYSARVECDFCFAIVFEVEEGKIILNRFTGKDKEFLEKLV